MSDIKVYGEHEPKTLAQMQRCMTVGSAVRGKPESSTVLPSAFSARGVPRSFQ